MLYARQVQRQEINQLQFFSPPSYTERWVADLHSAKTLSRFKVGIWSNWNLIGYWSKYGEFLASNSKGARDIGGESGTCSNLCWLLEKLLPLWKSQVFWGELFDFYPELHLVGYNLQSVFRMRCGGNLTLVLIKHLKKISFTFFLIFCY